MQQNHIALIFRWQLKVKYVRIGHLLNSYSKQLWGSISPVLPLTAANCIPIIHHGCSYRYLLSLVSHAAIQVMLVFTP